MGGSNDYTTAFPSLSVCAEATLMPPFKGLTLRFIVNKTPDSSFNKVCQQQRSN